MQPPGSSPTAFAGRRLCMHWNSGKKNNLTNDVRGSFVSESMIENQAVLEDLEIQTFTNIITDRRLLMNLIPLWSSGRP